MRKVLIGIFTVLMMVVLIEHLYFSAAMVNSQPSTSVASFDMSNSNDSSYYDALESIKDYPEAHKKAYEEIQALERLPSNSHEAGDIRKYLNWIFDMPWGQKDEVRIDIKKAKAILDDQHQGLDSIKDSILEHLAVLKRMPNKKAPIICFVGPPGVGKTTLAKAIAEATGRKFVRISMGGVNDEAAIRGFMRTYIGSKPGKIAQALKEAGTNNPVILLDEIDKIPGNSHQGDPSAALLEVLDPGQNADFKDHFLEVPLDLSDVMFITTANSYEIPPALLDRMEIIELSSYTQEEKAQIAKAHLIKKQMADCGLKKGEFEITDEGLNTLIANYTMEAGVRNLTRTLAKLCRKAVMDITQGEKTKVVITPDTLAHYLGASKSADNKALSEHTIGVTQGLAWTSVGGRLLPIEAVALPGKGKIQRTGNMGKVQMESILAAYTVAKTMLPNYGIKIDVMEDMDVHIHAPQAAVKKDGPSAGITIVTSIVSAMTKKPVRKDVCMTGEVTLNGKVLPIGGLKEKLIAAHRAGLKVALIPFENKSHLEDLPDQVKKDMQIIPVKHISEVLKVALVN